MKMNAVVLAGGKMTVEDPLFNEGRDGFRSLINIRSKPMVQWVIDALAAAPLVEKIFIIGLDARYGLTATKPLCFLPDAGGMFENIRAGVLCNAQDHPDMSKVIIASADIPAIRAEMVTWLGQQVEADPNALIYYSVIPQVIMERVFPKAGRSFVRFKDVAVCGGDLNVVDVKLFDSEQPLWQKLANTRKHPMQQAMILGLDTLVLVFLRLITLKNTVNRICRKLGISACALRSPYAEMGMDADKPHQLAILRKFLEDEA